MTAPANPVTYEFGNFQLDAAERVLMRDGSPVPLAPKVTETLLALVERAGHVVTKDELMALLWPDTFVDESNLAQNIFRLRKVLGGESEQAFIETIPRRGYRFTQNVTPIVGADVLVARRTRTRMVTEEVTTEAPAVAGLRTHVPLRAALIVAAGIGLLASAWYGIGRMTGRHDESRAATVPAPPASRFDRITTDSRAFDPAITPDGKFVAYALQDGETKSVWLKNVATGSTVQIMPPAIDYRGLTFSPDGNELYYKSYHKRGGEFFVARVPMLGGVPQVVVRDLWSDFSLSPDGRQITFIRGSSRVDNSQVLVVAAVNGGEERIVARQDARKNWFALWDSGPSWSPDGQRIAFCGGQHDPAGDRQVIFDVQLSDGSMTVMHAPPWKDISQVVWLAGSTSLAVVAASADSPAAQIWLLAYPSGTARRITNDVNDYGKLKVSAESRQLVVEQTVSLNHIWVMREGDEPHAKQLTFGTNNSDGLYGLSWTPDGRLLFVSNRTGELEIWSMSADGSNARQLTVHSSGPNRTPKATPDGRYIVFASTRSGKQHIWRMDADGSHPIPLTSGNSHGTPDVSPDGRWVYYTNLDVVPSVIERISIDGGSPVRIGNTEAGGKPMVSPDGKRIVYNHFDDVRGWRNAIVSVDNGELHVFDWNGERGIAQWRPDGRAIIYGTRTINSNLWMQPADGGAPRPITDFKEGHIWNFAISPDGRDYAIYRGTTMNDIVLIKDFM